ncbi:hypothetical protein AB9F45_36460, partial [Rhizobium leguminosarum]
KIGMVFQQFNLYPHMTVLQNIVEAPIGVHGESRKAATENALRLLERVGLSEKAGSYPRHPAGSVPRALTTWQRQPSGWHRRSHIWRYAG